MICEKDKCTGCFACLNICPKNAIEMKEDDFGYIYPFINEDKCINCNLCKKICPSNNFDNFSYPKKCFAGITNSESDLKKSASGGIATLISKYFINNDGIVYGASFGRECTVNHIRVTKIEELEKLRGSKYVHSYINDTFKSVKTDLINGKKVLFIGTPCQVAGLTSFLQKKYDNLFLIDLICHGVPSQKYLKEEVKRLIGDLDIDEVKFRDKNYSLFSFVVNKNKDDIYSMEYDKSPYFVAFNNGTIFRENCYSCKFAKNERCSDITIGDFWGLQNNSTFYIKKDNGVSVILPITDKGLKLLEELKDKIKLEERPLSEAIEGNLNLRRPSIKNAKVELFKKEYKKQGFYKAYKKVMKKNYYKGIIISNPLVKKIIAIRSKINNGKK